MAEDKDKDDVDLNSDVGKGVGGGGGGGEKIEHGTSEKNSVGSGAGPKGGPRANMRSTPPPRQRRYVEDEEERGSGSGSGATEALSELFVPVGQASRSLDDPHHHQFVPYETVSRTAGKEVEVRHCDIAGHEHRECWACNRADDDDHDHENCHGHGDRMHQVTRTVSVKRAIRVIAPAGIVEGRHAPSYSTGGQRLSASTAPAGAMDGLQAKAKGFGRLETESSDWAPSPRNPNASFSSAGRISPNRSRRPHRRSRQKTKRVEPNSAHNYPPTTNEDRGILRTSYKSESPTEKLRGLVSGLASAYSSQLPQTSLSSIARARSKETLDALQSYRRMSELPYLPDDCSICAAKDNQPSAKDILSMDGMQPSLNFKKRDQVLERVNEDLLKQEAGIVQSIESIRRTIAEADKNECFYRQRER